MRQFPILSLLVLGLVVGGKTRALQAADESPEFVAAAMRRRAEIPLGGDFRPNPVSPLFVAVGHGGRILPSRDDGQTWGEVYSFEPETEHVHGAQGVRDIDFG